IGARRALLVARARARAGRARDRLLEPEAHRAAADGRQEVDLGLGGDILAGRRPARAPAAAAPPAHALEEVAEDILEARGAAARGLGPVEVLAALEAADAAARAAAGLAVSARPRRVEARLERDVAELVVKLPLLVVRDDGVSGVDLLELPLGFFVARVDVG